mmetsp:Transcript_12050/g.28569  ORF Transcript_12050/g.28569 Transcript_12050/m.28569 type:complete len:163 (+) Transcript_12050:645-1133(+)
MSSQPRVRFEGSVVSPIASERAKRISERLYLDCRMARRRESVEAMMGMTASTGSICIIPFGLLRNASVMLPSCLKAHDIGHQLIFHVFIIRSKFVLSRISIAIFLHRDGLFRYSVATMLAMTSSINRCRQSRSISCSIYTMPTHQHVHQRSLRFFVSSQKGY